MKDHLKHNSVCFQNFKTRMNAWAGQDKMNITPQRCPLRCTANPKTLGGAYRHLTTGGDRQQGCPILRDAEKVIDPVLANVLWLSCAARPLARRGQRLPQQGRKDFPLQSCQHHRDSGSSQCTSRTFLLVVLLVDILRSAPFDAGGNAD